MHTISFHCKYCITAGIKPSQAGKMHTDRPVSVVVSAALAHQLQFLCHSILSGDGSFLLFFQGSYVGSVTLLPVNRVLRVYVCVCKCPAQAVSPPPSVSPFCCVFPLYV